METEFYFDTTIKSGLPVKASAVQEENGNIYVTGLYWRGRRSMGSDVPASVYKSVSANTKEMKRLNHEACLAFENERY